MPTIHVRITDDDAAILDEVVALGQNYRVADDQNVVVEVPTATRSSAVRYLLRVWKGGRLANEAAGSKGTNRPFDPMRDRCPQCGAAGGGRCQAAEGDSCPEGVLTPDAM